jgi:hypothetical protein
MKNQKIHFLIIIALLQCTGSNKYDPALLSPHEKDEIMMKIIRYVAKAPENVSDAEKFKSEYNTYYQERASQCFLEQFYSDGKISYFLVSQPAPSLTEKRHATGGKMRLNNDGSIQDYEEVFRTWKMAPDTLRQRSHFLFDKMVKGESLESFYTKNTGDQYIEFPDDLTYYDKVLRTWKAKATQ